MSTELLGILERVVDGAVRLRDTCKKRADGTMRAFGGVNVIMRADFWQLNSVIGTFPRVQPT